MSFTYRKATMADREKYLDFANLVFSNAHRPHDFQALIPKVYGEGRDTAHMQNIAVRDDGAIRGLVAIMPNTLNIMGTEIKYGYVGTVSVHPYARGEGHMKKLMHMAMDDEEANGCDLLMLGGQRQRYEYFGFTKGGIKQTHRVTATNLRHKLGDTDISDIEISNINAEDTEIIEKCAALQASRRSYASRPANDFFIVSGTWFNTLKAIKVNGEFAGYMIASGEGIAELLLYDWSLTSRVLKCYMQHANVSAVELGTGEYEIEINRQLAVLEEHKGFYMPEMLRVLNFPKVIGALMNLKASYSTLADGVKSFVIDGKPMTIKVQGGVPEVTCEASEDAWELTAIEAQQLFLNYDGEMLIGSLPYGWARLPLFMSHIDGF